MQVQGTVRQWSDDEGWGVLDSAETPGGCWVHFSAVRQPGHRSLRPEQSVAFRFEAASQDGFAYRATSVWPPSVEPGTAHPPPSSSDHAYGSRLTLKGDDGGDRHHVDNDLGDSRPAGVPD